MFWDNFERLCREQNMSPNAVAAKLGISSGSLTAWKNGRVPRGATLEKLEQYFDVTKAMLFADNEPWLTHEGLLPLGLVSVPLGML